MLTIHTIRAFLNELEKISAVRGPVKMYRNAIQSLSGGTKAFHGVDRAAERLPGILQSGGLRPGPGSHNTGVYMWNQKGPALTYIHTPNSTGFVFPHPKPGSFHQPHDLRPDGGMRPRMTIWNHLNDSRTDPQIPFPISQKMPLVTSPQKIRESRTSLVAPPELLRNARAQQVDPANPLPGGAIQHHKLRPIDSAIFNRAEADLKANRVRTTDGYGEYAIRPSKKELIDLHKRKIAPPKIRKLRADSENDIIDFASSYPDAVKRKA